MATPQKKRPQSQRKNYQQQPFYGGGGQRYPFYPGAQPSCPPFDQQGYAQYHGNLLEGQGGFSRSGWGSRRGGRGQPGGGPRQGGGAGHDNYAGRRQGGGQGYPPSGGLNSPPSLRAQSPPPPGSAPSPNSSKQQQSGAMRTSAKRGQLSPSSPPPALGAWAPQVRAGEKEVPASPQPLQAEVPLYSKPSQLLRDTARKGIVDAASSPLQENEGLESGGQPVASALPGGEEEESSEEADRDKAGDGPDPASPSSQPGKMEVACGVPGCRKTFTMSTLNELSLQSDVGQWVKGQENKPLRKENLTRLFKFVNAFLNSEGGIVYVHATTDTLHHLDEQLDNILMKLVPDGSLFKENFDHWIFDKHHMVIRVLPGHRPLSTMDFKTMASTNKGLMELTHLNMRHLTRELLLQQQQQQQQQPQPQVVGGQIEPTPNAADCSFDPSQLEKGKKIPFFYESTRTEAKSACGTTTAANGETLIKYAWSSLKLGNRITTFCKEEGGGSYFLGISEEQTDPVQKWTEAAKFQGVDIDGRKVWDDTPGKKVKDKKKIFFLARPEQVPTTQDRTGGFVCEGVFLPEKEHESLKKHLHTRIIGDAQSNDAEEESAEATKAAKAEMMWHPPLTNVEDQVQVLFHPVKAPSTGGNEVNGAAAVAGQGQGQGQPEAGEVTTSAGFIQDCYVIEIVVKNFRGLCFTDPLGPEAYEFKYLNAPDDQANRITWEDWLKRQQNDLREFAL